MDVVRSDVLIGIDIGRPTQRILVADHCELQVSVTASTSSDDQERYEELAISRNL